MKCKACEGIGSFEVLEKGISYKNACYLCEGVGETTICKNCNGLGEFISNYRFTPCMVCRGNGYSPKIEYVCRLCDNTRVVYVENKLPWEEDAILEKEMCDCSIQEHMIDEKGNNTKYFYEIHNVRRNYNGV